MCTLATFTQHNIGSPTHCNHARLRNKMYPNWKEGKKYNCHIILYIHIYYTYTQSTVMTKKKSKKNNKTNKEVQ